MYSEETKGGLEIAVSDSPVGPFHALMDKPLVNGFHHGAQPIDAHLFKDDDGTIYLLYGGWGHCNIAIMNEEMNGFVPFPDGEIFKEITPPDYVEGPCVFKRGEEYYFMWSAGNWSAGTYHVNIARAKSLFDDFSNYRTILQTGDSEFANGPGHNGYFYLAEQDRYLMVYHRHHNCIRSGNARFLCIDDMPLDENGNVLPIKMTKEWKMKIKGNTGYIE
jgi:beta-xylosidase